MLTSRFKLLCLLSCFCCSASSELKVVEADPGHDVVLPCQGPRDADVDLLEWTRADLESDDYVFFFRDNQIYDEYQLPSFHGRVKLRDPTMADGDASVVLRNVTTDDAGTYECRVAKSSAKRSRRSAPELTSSVTLKVEHSDQTFITAEPGRRVVLPCVSYNNGPVTGVEWVRPDLIHEGHVFMSRDGKPDPDNQHPLYKNLVELKDKEMKDGDASLVLKNVVKSDGGTYECRVIQGMNRKKRSINLDIQPGDTTGQSSGGGHVVHVGLVCQLLYSLLLSFV